MARMRLTALVLLVLIGAAPIVLSAQVQQEIFPSSGGPQPLRPVRDETATAREPAPRYALHPEGSSLINRAGRVTFDDKSQRWLFDPLDRGENEPPLILMPSRQLMSIEQSLEDSPQSRFRLTGTITQYRGENHLLIERADMLATQDQAPADEPPPPAPASDNPAAAVVRRQVLGPA